MKVIDPGHVFQLDILDGGANTSAEVLTFVKRQGSGFPGNVGAHAGTTIQEVCRALIKRIQYVDGQASHPSNQRAIEHLRSTIHLMEVRAAERHGYKFTGSPDGIENEPGGANGHLIHLWK